MTRFVQKPIAAIQIPAMRVPLQRQGFVFSGIGDFFGAGGSVSGISVFSSQSLLSR